MGNDPQKNANGLKLMEYMKNPGYKEGTTN